MKPYLLFVYDHYHPSGGAYDFNGSFDSIEEAETHLHANCNPHVRGSWAHVCKSDEQLTKVAHFQGGGTSQTWEREK